MTNIEPLDPAVLPTGVRSRFLDGINGLRIHILEAGHETPDRPCVLLLHGFPELAYSWRKVMPPLAAAGFHVVAPDLRGYGRTTGWDGAYDSDLRGFRLLNAVRDALGVIWALGYQQVAGVVGHDFGSPVAAWCALVRPDVFRTVTLMSAPFAGPPALPAAGTPTAPNIHAAMAALDRPRKHYQWYYSTRPANSDMTHCKQGVHDFLRAYYHHKSADWKQHKPHRLAGWTAEELAKMPTYYIMDLHEDMPTTVAHGCPHLPRSPPTAGCPTTNLPSMPPSTRATASRAACNGIAAAPAAWTRRSCNCSLAGPLTCPPCSLREPAIGAPIRHQARSNGCSRRPAHEWKPAT